MAKKIKKYDEAEIIKIFGLNRLAGNDAHPLMHRSYMAVSQI